MGTVAHIKDHFLPRSETFIFSLITSLRQYRSIVIDRHKRQNPLLFPVPDHYSPAGQSGSVGSLIERVSLRLLGRSPFLEQVLKNHHVDLLHAHFGQMGALFVPVARRLGIPLITSFYGKDLSVFVPHRPWKSRFEALWEFGCRFLSLGPAMSKQLVGHGCPDERIVIVPLPVDFQRFAFAERSAPSDGGPVRLLTAGRLIPKKGIDVLLDALAMIASDHAFKLQIAGDGPQRADLEKLTTELGLEERVEFLGWVNHQQLCECFYQADIFVLASRTDPLSGETEGTPTVLLEAQATGLPVLSTYHADIPSIVLDRKSGLLVPEGNAEALAAALDQLLDRPSAWPALGRSGSAFVRSRHEMSRVGAQVEAIYDECLDEYVRQ